MMHKPSASAGVIVDPPFCGDAIARINARIEARCGLDFGDARRPLLDSSLRARMQQLEIPAPEGYLARLCSAEGDQELATLINGLTITETQFFRDPAQFRLLRRHILPALMAQRGAEGQPRLRVCSAGCASGEEPYSVALTWQEMEAARTHPDCILEIVGIDVNTDMLDAARARLYSARSVRNVDQDGLSRYFTPVGRDFQLDAAVGAQVRFEHGSLIDDGSLGAGRYDLILCKNVSIYFRPDMTRRLVRQLHRALNPGGYLLLGHSESLWQMEEGLVLVEHDGVFCYQKPLEGEAARPAAPPRAEQTASPEAPARQYERCLEAIRSGDWGRARRDVEALIGSDDTFIPAHLLLAGVDIHLGRYPEARARAEHVLRLNTLEPRAHLLLGMIAARAGHRREAIDRLRRALDLDDSLALAYFWLGNLYCEEGETERAAVEYTRAVARHEQRQLNFTEEFAADLRPAQIVDYCRTSLQRLGGTW
jgi:chemotaxis protein methyltransferase CheR